jgi:hypothetical protein
MSINRITFLDQVIPHGMFIFNNPSVDVLHFYDSLDLRIFLNRLKIDKAYVVTFEFVTSLMVYNEETPVLSLSKPILITKNSNPKIISDYLKERIDLAIDIYYLDDSILDSHNNPVGPGIVVNYSEINLF